MGEHAALHSATDLLQTVYSNGKAGPAYVGRKKIPQKDDDYDNEVVITIYFTYIMQALGKLLSGRVLIIHLGHIRHLS